MQLVFILKRSTKNVGNFHGWYATTDLHSRLWKYHLRSWGFQKGEDFLYHFLLKLKIENVKFDKKDLKRFFSFSIDGKWGIFLFHGTETNS